jgi:biopolymer transport protein ExbB/TolQ
MAMLFVKSRKVKFQARALELAIVPEDPDFFLNETTARGVLEKLRAMVDHPRHFILLKRIDTSLANLQNIGEIRDVAAVMKNQSENDEEQVASSYILPNAMVWAVPILGFIGTVLGLSTAIGEFANTISSGTNIEEIKANLSGVTAGLSTAFETTLVALVFALLIQLYLNFLQSKESEFLDECNEYCHVHIISKLRSNLHAGLVQQTAYNQGEAPPAQEPPQEPPAPQYPHNS